MTRFWPASALISAFLVAAAALYARGLLRVTRRRGRGLWIRRAEAAAFAASLLAIAVALLSPLTR